MDMNMQLGKAGTDIMELCNALPDLDASEEISELLPLIQGEYDAPPGMPGGGPSGGSCSSSAYGDLPSPELIKNPFHPDEVDASTPDSQSGNSSSPESEMSAPSSPESDEPVLRRPTVWSTMAVSEPPAPPHPPKRPPTQHPGKMTFTDIEARRLERLNKNKKAAQALRRRKKQYLQQADSDLRRLKDQNTLLRNKVSSLLAENEVLRKENVFYTNLFSKRSGAGGGLGASQGRPAGAAARVALGIMAVTMVVTLAFNASQGADGGPLSSVAAPFEPAVQRRLLAEDDMRIMDTGGLLAGGSGRGTAVLVPVPIQPVGVDPVGMGGAASSSPLTLPCSEEGSAASTALVGAHGLSAGGDGSGAALALPCSPTGGSPLSSRGHDPADVGTLLQLLQQQIMRVADDEGGGGMNTTHMALDWNALAQLGSAFYSDRTYLFAPTFATKGHAKGLLAGTIDWAPAGAGSTTRGGGGGGGASAAAGFGESRQLARKASSSSFPAQAQAMAVSRVQAVLETLTPIERFFLQRILAYERDGVVDIEGMQQETVDWTELADGGREHGVSILMPTPDDDDAMGIIELDCAVTAARRWTLAMPIADSA